MKLASNSFCEELVRGFTAISGAVDYAGHSQTHSCGAILPTAGSPFFNLFAYDELTSTMDIGQQLVRGEDPCAHTMTFYYDGQFIIAPRNFSSVQIVLARRQLAGRGRNSRLWHSPLDSGIYVSFVFPAPEIKVGLSGFSLALGLAVVETCAQFGADVGLKWPNDVLVLRSSPHGLAKLAGILVETTGCSSSHNGSVIVGIGLNLHKSSVLDPVQGISLEEIVERKFSYPEVFWALVDAVLRITDMFYETGFAPFASRWNELSLINGRIVSWPDGRRAIEVGQEEERRGQVLGVDEYGGLVVSTLQGDRIIYGGEVIFQL